MRTVFHFAIAFALAAVHSMAHASEPNSPGLQDAPPTAGRFVKTDEGYMVPYTLQIPGTDIKFTMVPIPGGVVEMGAGAEAADAEQPTSQPKQVKLAPYWIAEHEVTWDAYWPYMTLDGSFAKIQQLRNLLASTEDRRTFDPVLKKHPALWQAVARSQAAQAKPPIDGLTAPTALYDPSATYESGEEPKLPAVTMTPYAAKQYTKWLSRLTGVDHRLPSEAEWEHAALAGGPAPYGAGAAGKPIDADLLDDYAWTDSNADYAAHEVKQKQPNAWGLYDMVGNVAELVLDGINAESEANAKTLGSYQGVAWPKSADGRIAKGGFYDAPPVDCRIVSRMPTSATDWKLSDPNIPTSPWWFADYPATGVGFRIVRPLHPMDTKLQQRVWEIDHESIREDVATRIKEGRGKQETADRSLPQAIEQLQSKEIEKLLN